MHYYYEYYASHCSGRCAATSNQSRALPTHTYVVAYHILGTIDGPPSIWLTSRPVRRKALLLPPCVPGYTATIKAAYLHSVCLLLKLLSHATALSLTIIESRPTIAWQELSSHTYISGRPTATSSHFPDPLQELQLHHGNLPDQPAAGISDGSSAVHALTHQRGTTKVKARKEGREEGREGCFKRKKIYIFRNKSGNCNSKTEKTGGKTFRSLSFVLAISIYFDAAPSPGRRHSSSYSSHFSDLVLKKKVEKRKNMDNKKAD